MDRHYRRHRGPVAQGIEQQPSKLKGVGSNPTGVTNKIWHFLCPQDLSWGTPGAQIFAATSPTIRPPRPQPRVGEIAGIGMQTRVARLGRGVVLDSAHAA